ncbi:MAG: hypothetical protein LBL52_00480 [Rickettsiales bacterium]|jgi:hypothetical protein|nr:hypothetical protein [Rickettsiales bacterium]
MASNTQDHNTSYPAGVYRFDLVVKEDYKVSFVSAFNGTKYLHNNINMPWVNHPNCGAGHTLYYYEIDLWNSDNSKIEAGLGMETKCDVPLENWPAKTAMNTPGIADSDVSNTPGLYIYKLN